MSKKQKIGLVSILVALLLSFGGILTYRTVAANQVNATHVATLYGVQINYPSNWKQASVETHTTKAEVRPGLTVSSPDPSVIVTIGKKYEGDTKIEYPETASQTSKSMLLSTTSVKSIPGVSEIQWIRQDLVNGVGIDYVAVDSLVSNEQLAKLSLVQGKMTDTGDIQPTFRIGNSTNEVSVQFNSQEPLTLDQALAWLQRPEAKIAHTLLIDAQPMSATIHP